MTSNTDPSGVASASSELTSVYAAWKAFDKSYAGNNAWAPTPNVGWLRYQFDVAKMVDGYAISAESGEYGANRSPRDWTFQGSNDGSSWTTLDTKTGITFADGETRVYSFTNTTAYSYYQINVTANNGDTYLTIGELKMAGYER